MAKDNILDPQDAINQVEKNVTENVTKSMEGTLEGKADASAVETIEKSLEGKADASTVDALAKSQKENADILKTIQINTNKTTEEEPNTLKKWLNDANLAETFGKDKGSTPMIQKSMDIMKNESSYTPSAGSNSAPYADDRQSDIEFDPHQMTLAKYIMSRTGSGGAYRFNHNSATTDNSGSKAKGAAFGQTVLGVSDQHVPYTTVGHILTVPREELNDTIALESYFREDMSGYLTDTINEQILTGAGGAAAIRGITHWSAAKTAAAFETTYGSLADSYGTAANQIDVINATCAALKGDNFMNQKYCFVNPDLIAQIQGLKATDGHYQLSSAVDPTGKVRSFIGGVELVENAAVASGSFYMFDTSALKWITREGMKAEIGYTGDDWQRNNVSLKVYGRYALVSGKPNGIVNGTFTNAISALNT